MAQSEELLERARVLIRDLREKLAAAEKRRPEPVAVVGMACRFPGSAETIDAFWRMILAGEDALTPVPRDRWRPEEVGDSVHRQGAFLRNVADFDAAFFDIVPREAMHMDPQQRLFLEVAWHALEHAGLTRAMLAGSETGVFVGIHNHSSDYYSLEVADLPQMDAHSVTGTSHDVIAGRLAYLLDLRGPSLVVNTACSSSLVAVHLACRSLMAGDCRTAVVGGVNLLLAPTTTIMGSKLNLLAPDGRCKPFDARADGFGRGEGCGVVVLKRLSDAVAQRDQILGVIRGSAINQDGRTNGLTAPNGLSQAAVIRRALDEAGVAPGQIGYVETHGTGTALGDPIEVEALADALPGATPCALGAVKGNIGHLEGAAGIAGLIKTLLVLQHGVIPPVAHLGELNPHLSLAGTRLEAPTAARPWTVEEGRLRVAGVSSFGWSGTNAHVIVAEAPARTAFSAMPAELIVPVSAATPGALEQLAQAYADAVEHLTPEQLVEFAYTAGARRTHYAFRRAAVGRDGAEIARQLRGSSFVPHPLRTRYEAGEDLDWEHLYPTEARVVDVPAYPFQRQRFWLNSSSQKHHQQAPDDWFFDIAWQPALPALTVPEVRVELEREAQEYVRQALAQMGDTPVVAPEHQALYRRLSTLSLPPAQESLTVPAASAEQALLRKCGPQLAGVLQGRVNPLHLLFSGGGSDGWTAERLYKESLAMQAGYAAIRRAFDELAAAKPLRVLEIGAGTGATTAVLLEHQRQAIAEYVISDLSPTLLQQAREQFSQYPFVRVMPLDIEQPVARQGFAAGAYDVVIAANVLHATADVRASLAEIRGLLAPGGALLLLETTAERLWVDLVFGLTEGWWRFQDHALRPESALLSEPVWERTLAEAGFASVAVAATGIPMDASVGQSVFLAHQPGARERRAPWVILADRGGLGEALAADVPGAAVVVRDGETWEPVASAGVLCCWALDGEAEAERLTWRVVQLLQSLTRAPHQPARLWLLTRGAVPTVAGMPVAIEQAPLWGLGATLAVEHPEHWGGLVDLDPVSEARVQAAAVWRVVTGAAGEDRIALRERTALVPRLAPGRAPSRALLPTLRADACYLVTGAFGGVGLPLCEWLVAQGARQLLLAGRRTIQEETVRRLEEEGVQVTAALCDVADPAAVAQLLARATQPIRGIFHAAAEPASQPLRTMTREQLAAAFRPKVQGTRVLLDQTSECPLDFVVLFSSSAAVLGARGRGHYGAANLFLDAVAAGRQREGRPACSIAWGAWEVLRTDTAAALEAVLQSGLTPMPAAKALNAMGRVMATPDRSYQLVASADWGRLKSALAVRGQDRLLSGIGAAGSAPVAADERPPQVSRRPRPMIEIVAGAVREVFGLAPDAPLEYDRGFFDLGMDSLMSVDLKARLEAELGRELPGTLTLNYPTVLALTAHLQGAKAPAPVVSAEAAAVAGLSNEEVRDALAAELALLRKGS